MCLLGVEGRDGGSVDDGTGRRVCERPGDVDGVSVGWGGIGIGV